MSLKQIAEIAGVSVPAVSAALRGKRNVSATTRERIVRIARDLGYEPHGPARALAKGKVGAIGVMPTQVSRYSVGAWDALVLHGFWQRIAATDMHLVMLSAQNDRAIPKMVTQRSVDGAAFFTRPHEKSLEWMRSRGMPVITVNVGFEDEVDAVCADDEGGIRAAIDHLASLGHERIAYVNTHEERTARIHSSVRVRQNAYLKAMAERDIRACAGSEMICPAQEKVAWLLKNDSPTALIGFDDAIVLQAMQALHRLGLRVPEDMSVVGIDDMEMCLLSYPMLTTVHVPFVEMGARAAELLLERLENPDLDVRRDTLPERVVVRESTAPPPEVTASLRVGREGGEALKGDLSTVSG